MNLTREQTARIFAGMEAWERANGVHPVDSPWFSFDVCDGVKIDGCFSVEQLRELLRLIDAEAAS